MSNIFLRSICIDDSMQELNIRNTVVSKKVEKLHLELLDLFHNAVFSLKNGLHSRDDVGALQTKISVLFAGIDFEEALILTKKIRNIFEKEYLYCFEAEKEVCKRLDPLAQEVLFQYPDSSTLELLNALGKEDNSLATKLTLHRLQGTLRSIRKDELDPNLTDEQVQKILAYFKNLVELDLTGKKNVTVRGLIPHSNLKAIVLSPSIHPDVSLWHLFPNIKLWYNWSYIFSWERDKEFVGLETWNLAKALEPFDLKLLESYLGGFIKRPTVEQYEAIRALVSLKNRSPLGPVFSQAFDALVHQALVSATLHVSRDFFKRVIDDLNPTEPSIVTQLLCRRIGQFPNDVEEIAWILDQVVQFSEKVEIDFESLAPIVYFFTEKLHSRMLPLAMETALRVKVKGETLLKLKEQLRQIPQEVIPPYFYKQRNSIKLTGMRYYVKDTYNIWTDIRLSMDTPLGAFDLLMNAIALKRACIPGLAHTYLAAFEQRVGEVIESATTVEEAHTLFEKFEASLPRYHGPALSDLEVEELYFSVDAMGKLALLKLLNRDPDPDTVEELIQDLKPLSSQLFVFRHGEAITEIDPSDLVKERTNCLRASVDDETIQLALKVLKNLKRVRLKKNTIEALKGGHLNVEEIYISDSPELSESAITTMLFPKIKKVSVLK